MSFPEVDVGRRRKKILTYKRGREGGYNCWRLRRRRRTVVSWLTHQVQQQASPSCFLWQKPKPPRLQSRGGLSVSYRRPTRIPKREQAPPLYWGMVALSLSVAFMSQQQLEARSNALLPLLRHFNFIILTFRLFFFKKKTLDIIFSIIISIYRPTVGRVRKRKQKIWNSIPLVVLSDLLYVCMSVIVWELAFLWAPPNSELWPNATPAAHQLVCTRSLVYSSSLLMARERRRDTTPPPGRHW
jgi:hypothetical protein